MTSIEINKNIQLIKELLDFIERITLKIKNKAIGYEIAFEIENFDEYYSKKLLDLRGGDILNFPGYSSNPVLIMKGFGGDIVLEKVDSRDYKNDHIITFL